MPHKGSAAFAPHNIGGVSEGRGGFAALRIASILMYSFAKKNPEFIGTKNRKDFLNFNDAQ
jgi:hypothetical protein